MLDMVNILLARLGFLVRPGAVNTDRFLESTTGSARVSVDGNRLHVNVVSTRVPPSHSSFLQESDRGSESESPTMSVFSPYHLSSRSLSRHIHPVWKSVRKSMERMEEQVEVWPLAKGSIQVGWGPWGNRTQKPSSETVAMTTPPCPL